ncbi:DEAD/DEAH box helicase [Ilumatobacter coccineus]|uniref:Putative ATP-dependent helicase n=1 Tax=Ilumatobacter coccineus (strain NBRC 103263 / KCTC 29153 / YM16-304) TaxID=1313172 RepID=A0A6C7EDF6_ILUCY|nr:DEAD/DEAH box helicase [Ilumatobacter coccineus]BAN04400.1 putative ATP-dependent helicase [Ilumatobacter coccineus YM16-304]
MKKILDPLAASERIDADYRSYLSTAFAPADTSLRQEFEAQLSLPGRTRKGPIVQATPPYTPGASLADLVAEQVLNPAILQLDPESFPPRRALYAHQENAIRQSSAGNNLVIATGTGSGKTECYLLPILNHLLEERAAGTISKPGVRALLLYPMNALANDQMKRIRSMFAPFPDITFGRYTGETKHRRSDALERHRQQVGADPIPGELIDRETMQTRPPHVLLTNFAMLEYLLLRPQDSTLFDGPTGRHWKFLVLDEVHVYDGAKGAEISMLLRRVRDRVNESRRGSLMCFGTSATLGRGVADSDNVANFANALFDEKFDAANVVHPQRQSLRRSDATWEMTESQLSRLHQAWLEGEAPSRLAESCERTTHAATVSRALFELLHREAHVVELQRALENGSADLDELAGVLTGFASPQRATTELIDLCIAAKEDESSAPLIPARYHLWLRASEGSFACFHPDHDATTSRLLLDRHERCPSCDGVGRTSQMFEIGVCRHCRQHYLVGALEGNQFVSAPSFQRELVHLLIDELTLSEMDFDEDEEALSSSGDIGARSGSLCVSCGRLGDGKGCDCDEPRFVVVTQAGKDSAGEVLKRCVACERQSPTGVVQRFLSGSEAPVAVVATSLYQCLPPVTEQGRRISAAGRKLLMFSDSRQDAAFFAPYLRRTYNRAVERHMIWQRLSADPEPFLFNDLVQPLRRDAERAGLLDDEAGRGNAATVSSWILAEILSTDRRQSLDGLGLAEIAPKLPRAFDPPSVLTAAGFNEEEALAVTRVLLDSLRHGAAVSVPDNVDVKEDPRFGPRNTTTAMRGSKSEPGVLAWTPGRGRNRRLDYLEKLFKARSVDVDPLSALEAIWDDITEPAGPLADLVLPTTHKQWGTVFVLNHERFVFRTAEDGAVAFTCSVCQQITWTSVSDVCPTFRCNGRLSPNTAHDVNHYSSLYQRLSPLPLAIEEHTGQLASDQAAILQEQFTRGELNALSCSTTFELGVDVGEVQAVLMKNVPPSPANYVQRAGRAGRRLGSAALVVTFAQRRNHDRSYYDNPEKMVDGVISPPIVVSDNEAIVRRHVHAVAWAEYDRARVDRGGSIVKSMFDFLEGDPDSVADGFSEWLRSHPQSLRDALERLVPVLAAESIGLRTWDWVERLHEPNSEGFGGWLALLVRGARRDHEELTELEAEASEAKNYRRAQAFKRTRTTLDRQLLLNKLAQRGVLPKYGFPVDVVELDVSRSASSSAIDLSRDLRLGILDYAPGAKVVASNRLWESKGIKQVQGRDLPLYEWGICDGCGVLRTQITIAGTDPAEVFKEPCEHCKSEDFARGKRGRFIIPLFGFVGDLCDEKPGDSRPPREGHLETHFAEFDGPPPEIEIETVGGRDLALRSSRRGWITVFNRGKSGRGFSYCSWCGYATNPNEQRRTRRSGPPPKHAKPWSGDVQCEGSLRPVDLGHRFITNVIELHLPFAGLPWTPEQAALSALHALIGAAPALGIANGDIGGSLSVGPHGDLVGVIFDDVPGGAGHTRFLRENLEEFVRIALERASSCTCGAETSCYGCLRSYQNQHQHDLLVRQAAIDVLSQFADAASPRISH